MKFLLQHVHRHIGFFHNGSLLLRLWKSLFVHFLILIQRYLVNLHCYGRNHVGRLLVEDIVVQGLNINLLIANDICCNELTTALLVESLHRSILNTRELTNHRFHLLQFDTEATNLYLSVTTSYKRDVAIGQIAHDIACTINPVILCFRRKWIRYIYLCRLLRAVQITTGNLWACHP